MPSIGREVGARHRVDDLVQQGSVIELQCAVVQLVELSAETSRERVCRGGAQQGSDAPPRALEHPLGTSRRRADKRDAVRFDREIARRKRQYPLHRAFACIKSPLGNPEPAHRVREVSGWGVAMKLRQVPRVQNAPLLLLWVSLLLLSHGPCPHLTQR